MAGRGGALRVLDGGGIYGRLWRLAQPFLDTRENAVHTRIAVGFALRLLAREGGEEAVVLPAVILHDVGWKRIPERLQRSAFGPGATRRDLNRRHEVAGAAIAARLIAAAWPQCPHTAEILAIIEGHDSRREPLSLNDRLVKDADKLWRYTAEGFAIDTARFGETRAEGLVRLAANLTRWFLTATARRTAAALLGHRRRERPSAGRPRGALRRAEAPAGARRGNRRRRGR